MGKYLEYLKKEFVFEIESQKFENCHASSICALQEGSILAVWGLVIVLYALVNFLEGL